MVWVAVLEEAHLLHRQRSLWGETLLLHSIGVSGGTLHAVGATVRQCHHLYHRCHPPHGLLQLSPPAPSYGGGVSPSLGGEQFEVVRLVASRPRAPPPTGLSQVACLVRSVRPMQRPRPQLLWEMISLVLPRVPSAVAAVVVAATTPASIMI